MTVWGRGGGAGFGDAVLAELGVIESGSLFQSSVRALQGLRGTRLKFP